MDKHLFVEDYINMLRSDIERRGYYSTDREDAYYIRGLIDAFNLVGVLTDDESANYRNTLKDLLGNARNNK